MSGPRESWAEVDAADSAPTCRAPFCGSWTAVMRYRVFGVSGIVVCMRPECGAWGELRSDELLDGYEWREHAARMRRGDCQPRQEACKVDGEFASVAEHIAAWKAGGRRWAKVEGFNVDAWQAAEAARPMQIFADTSGDLHVRMSDGAVAKLTGESPAPAEVEPDPVEARFVAMATAMAQDPAMAVLCGVPAVIEEPPDPIADRLAYLQRVQQHAQTDPEVHQTCDTQDAILDAVVALLELAVRR